MNTPAIQKQNWKCQKLSPRIESDESGCNGPYALLNSHLKFSEKLNACINSFVLIASIVFQNWDEYILP